LTETASFFLVRCLECRWGFEVMVAQNFKGAFFHSYFIWNGVGVVLVIFGGDLEEW
jgi:hypothetical protein